MSKDIDRLVTELRGAASAASGWDTRFDTPPLTAWSDLFDAAADALARVSDEEWQEQIAIGVHTGLRKGSEAPDSAKLWRAISESNDTSWSDAASYCVHGMKYMGYRLVREQDNGPRG